MKKVTMLVLLMFTICASAYAAWWCDKHDIHHGIGGRYYCEYHNKYHSNNSCCPY